MHDQRKEQPERRRQERVVGLCLREYERAERIRQVELAWTWKSSVKELQRREDSSIFELRKLEKERGKDAATEEEMRDWTWMGPGREKEKRLLSNASYQEKGERLQRWQKAEKGQQQQVT